MDGWYAANMHGKEMITKSLLEVCKQLRKIAEADLQACGPCDHDVGICVCGVKSVIKDAKEIIAKAEGKEAS